jgi:hypothetical protein
MFLVSYIAHKSPQVSSNISDSGSWIAHVSKGGLTFMKPELIPYFRGFESAFRQHHGVEVNAGPVAIAQLMSNVDKTNDIPQQIVRFFFRTRLNLRIRWLNKKLRLKSSRSTLKKLSKLAK